MLKKMMVFWDAYQGNIFSFFQNLITALVIIAAGRFAVWMLKKLIRHAEGGSFKIDKTLVSLLTAIVNYGIIIVCIIMILDAFGVNTNSLIAVLGAAGVAVGLALKDTLSNIAAGIILLVQQTYHRGDWIEFGSVQGEVKEIGLFTTILETFDGIYISAPNSCIWGPPLKNYSRNGKRRMELTVSIAYENSIDTAFRVLQEIAAGDERFLKEPAPQIMVQSLGERGVNLMLRVWASTGVYWDVYWDQMRKIKEKIEGAGLTIPFPQRDVHIIPKV